MIDRFLEARHQAAKHNTLRMATEWGMRPEEWTRILAGRDGNGNSLARSVATVEPRTLFGIPVVTDRDLPKGVAELRGKAGVVRIEGLDRGIAFEELG